MYLTFYYSQGEVIIFEGVKITDTQFGQNFEAIFRENGGLSEHGTTPVEFVMPKSSFPKKFGQGFALGELTIQTPDSWKVPLGSIQRIAPKQVIRKLLKRKKMKFYTWKALHQSY